MDVKIPALIADICTKADVKFNGSRPWDIRVNDNRTFSRVLKHGTLGLGESYMDGWWDCDAPDDMLSRLATLQADA